MSEYFTFGWWVVYALWAFIVGGIWLDASNYRVWSLGQWAMFITILGPVVWVLAAIGLVLVGLCMLWEFLGGVGGPKK